MDRKLDERFMKIALDLAMKAQGRTSPNPIVGAVIVGTNGQIVGSGYHQKAGEPHAEVIALREAGELARGASMYVTLEPCCHYGRTPPCTDAIINSGIARVVVATLDPNPLVNGKGIKALSEAGIKVETGVLEKEAKRANEAFFKYVTTGLPFVTLKAAMSLDGKVATRNSDSKWISSEASRQLSHRWRNEHDAIVVGLGTILADDPELTCRIPGGRDPVRVILDSKCRTPTTAAVLNSGSKAPTIIMTTNQAPPNRVEALLAKGAEVIVLDSQDDRPDFKTVLKELANRNIINVLLEGGPTLAASALNCGVVDKIRIFIAPMIIGGVDAPGPVGGLGASTISEALSLGPLEVEPVGPDLLITAYCRGS